MKGDIQILINIIYIKNCFSVNFSKYLNVFHILYIIDDYII